MVAKKTHKASKASYAERVLGAFTQVQREHKKHYIHVATIRAQVKRNAVEKKEKLGPHWSSWVSKAIRKLEEDGILESSQGVVGNISLTPSGKKAIADARQSLSTMTNTFPASVPEDLIWRYLTQATPTIYGTKRGRPSIVRQGHDELDHSPDGPSSVRSKRRRITAVVASLPNHQNSRMTKLQLQAELQALQKEKENRLWLRESSPLTDIDMEEEAARLRDKLKEKEEEIERIKQELLEARSNSSLITSTIRPYRPPTPEIPSSPTASMQASSRVRTHSRDFELVRTQSGSFISLLSRQPTPPRSPGAASDAIFETTGTEDDGFATQEDRVQTPITATSASPNDMRVIELERDVASRVARIEALQAQLSQVQENSVAAQRAIMERDERLSTLSTSFSKLQTDATEKALDFERQIAALRDLESLKAGLESAQSMRLADLEHELNERNTLIKTMNQDREKDIDEMALLRESLSTAEREKGTLTLRLADSERQVQKYCSQVAEQRDAADVELHSQRSINREFEVKVEALLTRISALDQEVQGLQQSKNLSDALLLEARSEQTSALGKLRETETSNESLLGQLTTAMDEKSELQAVLNVYKDRLIALYAQYTTTTGKQDAISLAQQAPEASTLRSELALATQSTDDFAARLAAIMDERGELLSELDKAQATISVSASSVNQFKHRLATTADNLLKAEKTAAEFQSKLIAATDKLNSQQERTHALVAEVELKEAELMLLAQRLSMAESLTEQYHNELVTNCTATQELQKQLSATENELKTTHDLLSSAQDTHILELEKQTTRISELEALVQGGKIEIDALQLQLSSTQSDKAELQKQVVEQTMELGEAKKKLDLESQRVTHLETEVAIATEKLQEAEEELLELRSSKAADEVTIETMKEVFSTHVEKQTQSLAVLNSQIISTQSSPAPPKRRSARTTSKASVPFKLS